MEQVKSPTVAICNGRETILLGTYNYMGMTFDPDVLAAGHATLDAFGSGTTGSRVLNGTYSRRTAMCETALREFYAHGPCDGLFDRIPGQSGHHQRRSRARATMSSSTSTATRRSMTGARWATPQIVAFRHNDVEALEKRLKRLPPDAGKLVVLEGRLFR